MLTFLCGHSSVCTAADPAATAWLRNFEKQQQALAAEVKKHFSEMPDRVMNPAFREELLRHEILGRVHPKYLNAFLKSPREQAFLAEFLSSPEWMEPFVGSGPFENTLIAMLSIAAIGLDDPAVNRPGLERRIAIATALETALAKRTPENAVKVYEYYRNRARAGSLHPGFPKLEVWEMRFAVGGRFAAEDLEYMGNRSNCSTRDANWACWQVNYVWYNPFGEYVHCDKYYRPWAIGGLPYAECTVKIGGVCGAISTTGVIAAHASGIPAVTMGEPGHCSYATRVRPGQWLDGNSIDGNNRTPHRKYFLENWSDLFAGDEAWQSPVLPKAQGLAWAANALSQADLAGRAALLNRAIEVLPGHVGHWQARIELAKQANVPSSWWSTHADALIAAFEKYPHLSWHLIGSMPLDKLPVPTKIQIQRAWLAACGKSVPGAIELFPADSIIAEMQAQRGNSDLKGLLSDVLDRCKPDTKLGAKLTAGCRGFVEKEMSRFAEKGDKAGWNEMAELGARLVTESYPHEHQPFPGELLSKGGLIKLSSAYREVTPLSYVGTLNGKGGFFHTGEESKPEAVIELGKPGALSGIVLINRPDFFPRAVPLKVSVSPDGKQWKQVFRTEKADPQWRVDLEKSKPKAKFVKIEGDYPAGRKDFLHLHGVFVYGTEAP